MIGLPPSSTLFPYTTLFRSDLCLVLLLAVLLLLLLVAPCLNCLEAVKKPPPVAFKVMCLLPITILTWRHQQDRKSGSAGMPRPISYAVFCLKKKTKGHSINKVETQVE